MVILCAVATLAEQGYGADGTQCSNGECDDLRFLINDAIAGFDRTPTLANVQEAIEVWGADSVQDLTVYLVGRNTGSGLRLDSTTTLVPADLATWLDTAQAGIPGKLTVIIDSDSAASLVAPLNPANATDRILIASAGATSEAAFINRGAVSFSRFFWNQTLNGATVRQSFSIAASAVKFSSNAQIAELDDNGNNMPNELLDGLLAGRYSIGSGFLLAGDDPLIGTLNINANLSGDFETITATNVTSTGTLQNVFALVTRPNGQVIVEPMLLTGSNHTARSYALCSDAGDYEIAVYAVDDDGDTSLPALLTVNRADPCTEFMFQSGFE